MDKMAYIFSMDDLLFTQEVLVETVGLVEGFGEAPVMRMFPYKIAFLLYTPT